MKYASFPYQPLALANYRAGACQTEKHRYMGIRASWVELVFDGDSSDMIIREAWYTCRSCHTMLEALREKDRREDDEKNQSVP